MKTAEELLQYGYAMASRKGFNASSIDDAAQAFAVGAWEAQQKVDFSKGSGLGYVTRGGLNGIKSYVRSQVKASRISRKRVEMDLDEEGFEQAECRIISGDYNSEDGEGTLSAWDSIADTKAVDPLAAAARGDMLEKASKALDALTEVQRTVLLARGEGQTLAQIGAALGCSRERVRQIEEKAREQALRLVA